MGLRVKKPRFKQGNSPNLDELHIIGVNKYAHLKTESSQVKKQLVGMAIPQEVFFYTFVLSIENRIKSLAILKAYEQWVEEKHNF